MASLRRIAVVGASLAGLEAVKTLRREGFRGEVVVFGREPHAPYDRPPLSKELLDGRFDPGRLALDLDEAHDAEWRLGADVTGLDAANREIRVGSGRPEAFDGIVLATGATAHRPRFPGERAGTLAGVHVVRTLDDGIAVARDLDASPTRVVVVGGGFIGAEVASTCRVRGLDVTVVEALATPLENALGTVVGATMGELQVDHGVDLRLGVTVLDIQGGSRVERVVLSDGTVLDADLVVLAVGVRPETSWLEGSGLLLEKGVVCDETCLAAPGIVAAGDVAVWPNRRYAEVRRVEHWDNAIRQGHHAARRLLAEGGAPHPGAYQPVPWFWSDQFDAKLQLAGSARSYDEFTVVSGSTGSRRFVGLYRRQDRLVAAVTLNAAKKMLASRQLLERNASWSEALEAVGERSRA